MDFPLRDEGYRYRPLRLTTNRQSGWDVYALQSGLLGLNYGLPKFGADGYFGDETAKAVTQFQSDKGLIVDGIAGIATQRQIALILCEKARAWNGLPHGIPYGHAEHESSFMLGNYTPPYTNGSRDCGVVQRNTQYTPAERGFNTTESIGALGSHLKAYHQKYRSWNVSDTLAWRLACGSWNAPAWTDRLARGESLSDSQRAHIERYMNAVTTYAAF